MKGEIFPFVRLLNCSPHRDYLSINISKNLLKCGKVLSQVLDITTLSKLSQGRKHE